MSLALSICVFLISLMQSVNGAQFLYTISLIPLFGEAAVPVFGNIIVPKTAMYASLQSHKLEF